MPLLSPLIRRQLLENVQRSDAWLCRAIADDATPRYIAVDDLSLAPAVPAPAHIGWRFAHRIVGNAREVDGREYDLCHAARYVRSATVEAVSLEDGNHRRRRPSHHPAVGEDGLLLHTYLSGAGYYLPEPNTEQFPEDDP